MGTMFLSSALSKLFKTKNVATDGLVFKLHYKFTAAVLLGASLMITGYQFFGNPIYCIMQRPPTDAKYKRFVETFCWIESTFSLTKAFDKEVGVEVVYSGVDNYKKGDEVVYHGYYQWVCLLLFLQCCMFLMPHIIWRSFEGGKIKQLLMDLDKPIVQKDDRKKIYGALSEYFCSRRSGHDVYFLKYIFCEILNLANVIGQMYLIDTFLHGEFTTYGTDVIKFINQEQEDRYDPMLRVFPRVTKCSFFSYGPSGDVQAHDVFCVLPLNILNEKIYVFLWFWFIVLASFTSLSVLHHLVLSVWSDWRKQVTSYACLIVDEKNLDTVLKKYSVGDWFVIHLLAKSMDKLNFKDFVDAMAKTNDDNDGTVPKSIPAPAPPPPPPPPRPTPLEPAQ